MIFLAAVAPSAYPQLQTYAALTVTDRNEIWFDRIVGLENSGLINGQEYAIPFRGATTHPFYQFTDGTRGWVVYNKSRFSDVGLLYDIFNDNLVLKYQRRDGFLSLIQLDKARIDSFNIYNHHFRKFDISDAAARLAPGFYDVLYDSKTLSLVARRTKETHIVSASRIDYDQADRYYFIDRGKWIRLGGRTSLSALLSTPEERKKLSAYIRANHIRIGKRRDEDLKKIASFCQSLRQSPGR